MIDEVMFEVRELSGQIYVNQYHGQTAESEPIVAARVGHVTDADNRFEQQQQVDEARIALAVNS
jgi:hypothetical protein